MQHSLFSPRLLATAIAGVAIVLLSGCESMNFSLSKKVDYKSVAAVSPLEIPPDLSTPGYDDRYQVANALGAGTQRPVTSRPNEVLPANPDARLVRAGNERWLVVKATPEQVWSALKAFWIANGYAIAVEQPPLGIMETDWSETKVESPDNWLSRWANKYVSFAVDSYKRDKFRTRIEYGLEPNTIEIYISHRGSEQQPRKFTNSSAEDWNWVPSPPNARLEAEYLERLKFAFSAKTEPTPQATASAASASGAMPVATAPIREDRAFIDRTPAGTVLMVEDSYDRAWRRVGLALDRTGFTVVDRDRSKGLYFVRYSNPDIDKKKDESWVASMQSYLQFWKTSDKDKVAEQYRVVVTQADPHSVVTVQNPAGAPDRTANSEKILALLQDQLK